MTKKLLPFCSLLLLLACQTPNKAQRFLRTQPVQASQKPVVFADVDLHALQTQVEARPKVWSEVYAFMRNHDLDTLSPGKYPIDGDLAYASVTEAPDKPFEDTRWESHRKYIDLQYIIRGKEKMGMAPVAGAQVTDPYREDRDVAHYQIDKAQYYVADPSTYYLFFPAQAHRPSIQVTEGPVKKLVIKIRVAGE